MFCVFPPLSFVLFVSRYFLLATLLLPVYFCLSLTDCLYIPCSMSFHLFLLFCFSFHCSLLATLRLPVYFCLFLSDCLYGLSFQSFALSVCSVCFFCLSFSPPSLSISVYFCLTVCMFSVFLPLCRLVCFFSPSVPRHSPSLCLFPSDHLCVHASLALYLSPCSSSCLLTCQLQD